MRKPLILFLTLISFLSAVAQAEDVVIKDPGYFKAPFRDSQPLFPDSLVFSSDAEEIHIPDIGIPSRYITCLPKDWQNDSDCHVISVAWSDSLKKWIWVDPTFAAYVTDENGLLLHPGEVRYRLRHDLPLILNEDANWNHEYTQDKEDYLDEYMAKNLYLLEANSFNQAEPEGQTLHPVGKFVTLVPEGYEYSNSHFTTSDDQWFWQPPLLP